MGPYLGGVPVGEHIYNAKQEHSDTTNLQERDLIHENENNHVNADIRGLTVTKQHHSHNLTCWKKSYAHQRVGYGHQIDLHIVNNLSASPVAKLCV
jgi:hypothetical protein